MALDIADVREAIDSGDKLLWIPTEHMLADGLTKHIPKENLLIPVSSTGRYRIRYELEDGRKRSKAILTHNKSDKEQE